MAILNNLNTERPVQYKNIKEIFSYNLVVPDIQRFYSWGTEQFNSFIDSFEELNDLNPDKNEKSRNYLGNIVLTEAEKNEKNIIDGQQRLCSFLILLIAFRDVLNGENILGKFDPSKLNNINEEEKEKVEEMNDNIKNNIKLINDIICRGNKKSDPFALGESNDEMVISFVQSPLDEKEAKKLFKGTIASKTSKSFWVKNYQLAKKFILDCLSDEELFSYQKLCDFYKKIANLNQVICFKTLFLVNTVGDVSDSFAIFEGMNNNGLNLTPFDLVNSWLRSTMHKDNVTKYIQDEYQYRINSIREGTMKNPNTLLKDYLSYWVNSYNKNEISDANLFKTFKELYPNRQQEKEKFVENFSNDLKYIDEFLTGTNYETYYLDWMNRKKIIPIIYQLKHNNYSDENINELISWLIRYSILFLNFEEKSPGTFQYRIRDIMKYIDENKSKKVNISMICNGITEVKKDFEHYLKDIDKLLQRLIQREISDFNLMKTLLLMIYENWNRTSVLNKTKINFDHSIPKKYEKFKTDKRFIKLGNDDNAWKEYINSLGNIVISMVIDNNKKNNNIENLVYSYPDEGINNLQWNNIDLNSETVLSDINERSRYLCKIIKDKDILWLRKTQLV